MSLTYKYMYHSQNNFNFILMKKNKLVQIKQSPWKSAKLHNVNNI